MLVIAQEEARQLEHNFIGTEHILLGLTADGDSIAGKVLESFGLSLDAVRDRVSETIGSSSGSPTGSPPFTPRAKKCLELALREALQLGHNYIGTEHILLGVIREGQGVGAQILVGMGVDLVTCRQRVIQFLAGYNDPRRGSAGRRRSRGQGEYAWGPNFPPTEFGSPGQLGLARRRFGIRPELLPVGDAWSLEVVRAGRSAEAYAACWEALSKLAGRLGLDIDNLEPEAVTVNSVETKDGPGIRLMLEHAIDPDDPDDLGDPGDSNDPDEGDPPAPAGEAPVS